MKDERIGIRDGRGFRMVPIDVSVYEDTKLTVIEKAVFTAMCVLAYFDIWPYHP